MLPVSQMLLAILFSAPPTSTAVPAPASVQIVQLENVTVTLTPELVKVAKFETVKTAKGLRLRLVAGGVTLEAMQFSIKVDGKNDFEVRITPTIDNTFSWLNSIEYQVPILPASNIQGVIFCDHGTVEKKDAPPASGPRIAIPQLGPLGFPLDFTIPENKTVKKQLINFSIGLFGAP